MKTLKAVLTIVGLTLWLGLLACQPPVTPPPPSHPPIPLASVQNWPGA